MWASGLPFYPDDTRCAFKNKTDYMLNYPQNLHCLYCQSAITLPIRYFKQPILFAVHLSFACRHLACHILDYARYTFKNKTDNMINNAQNLSGVNARLGL
jgi:hypothetical protein